MSVLKTIEFKVSKQQKEILEKISNSRTKAERLVEWTKIILLGSEQVSGKEIGEVSCYFISHPVLGQKLKPKRRGSERSAATHLLVLCTNKTGGSYKFRNNLIIYFCSLYSWTKKRINQVIYQVVAINWNNILPTHHLIRHQKEN